VALDVSVLSMVGTNRSIHHPDSIAVPVDMVAAGLWGKWNWEIRQFCYALRIDTWTHFALIGIFQLHHRYNCCSHRYGHQSQLELRSYRTERIVIISIGTDRNILLFVVSSLLCFKGDELRYFSLILNRGT
jgi:hypothetical protein